jgi:ribosomal protein L40E
MSETTTENVENSICPGCGAHMRDNAGFCHKCGATAASPSALRDDLENGKLSSAWFDHEIAGSHSTAREIHVGETAPEPSAVTRPLADNLIESPAVQKTVAFEGEPEKPIEKPAEVLDAGPAAPVSRPVIQDQARLKSAAAMRQKAKSNQKKVVEYVWEEPENAPNIWFLLVSLLLALFAGGLLLGMLYLK